MKYPDIDFTRFSEIKISYEPAKRSIRAKDRIKVKSSDIGYEFFNRLWEDRHYIEKFAILLLDRANGIIGIRWISTGGASGTVADPKLIFQTALKAHACSVILCHNHPSGNMKPSQNDIDLTNKLKAAGKALDLQVLDHLILGDDEYYSFADESLM